MKPEDHKDRAMLIERSLLKCLPADYEMTIEAAMLAGTHWLNYLLHQRGVTSPDADVLHTYMLTVNELRKYRVADARAIDSLSEIEDIRPGYVRGNLPDGEAAAARARDLLTVLRNSALESTVDRSVP